jgi:hypothetical protein
MKKTLATMFAVLIATGATQGAYTYTYGPGTAFGTTSLYATESVLVHGGEGDRLVLHDYSSATILSTTRRVFSPEGWWVSGGITAINLDSHARATVSGGEMHGITVSDNAQVELSGGIVDRLSSTLPSPIPALPQDKYIQVVCKSWNYNAGTKMLTGAWADDSLFNIQLVDTATYPTTFDSINFTIVPEPLTLGLLAFGSLLARRLRRA